LIFDPEKNLLLILLTKSRDSHVMLDSVSFPP